MKLKLVLLGPMAVGKTALCNRLKYDRFEQNYQVTIGAGLLDYQTKINGISIEAEIWDTAGMERHRSLSPIYFRDASIAFFVYDMSETSTIDQLDSYLQEFKANNGDSFYGIVCGNKLDITSDTVSKHAGVSWAEKHGFGFVEASAKTGEGVTEAFNKAFEGALQLLTNKSSDEVEFKSDLSSPKKKKGKGCC